MNDGRKPLVSVIIPTYRRIEEVSEALRSVFNQTYANIEIIVVNDDPQVKIKNHLPKVPSLRCLDHPTHQNSAAARNSGIRIAGGKYIAFLDDDDIWLPDKIEEQVKTMETLSEDWVGTYSWFYKTDSRRNLRNSSMQSIESPYEGDFTYELLSRAKKIYIGGGSGLLARTEIVREIDGYDESFIRHTDWEFLIRLMKRGKIKLTKKRLWINIGELHVADIGQIEDSVLKLLKKFKAEIKAFGGLKRNVIYAGHYLQLSRFYWQEFNFKKIAAYFLRALRYPAPISPREYLPSRVFFAKGLKKLLTGRLFP
jgi:glycosyltransferase involved in cell wall biosynthesis